MCEYNLRGLTETRCPECGYQFLWKALLDPNARLHPYLFEHHPESNFKSFWKTAAGGLIPWRFWKTLNPAQKSKPRRLFIYWLICAGFSIVTLLAYQLYLATFLAKNGMIGFNYRTMIYAIPPTPAPRTSLWDGVRALDPPLYSIDFIRQAARFNAQYAVLLRLTILHLVWPWLTYVTMLIFSQTMRRVNVKPIHALRCILYTTDIGVWLGLPLLLLIALLPWVPFFMVYIPALLLVFSLPFVLIFRLASAYKHYMQFDKPLLTVIASQLIVLLACSVVEVNL